MTYVGYVTVNGVQYPVATNGSLYVVAGISTTGVLSFTAGNIPCFVSGTRIATPSGEAAVETLREGDLVVTASGAVRPVRWIGHRRVDLLRHPEPIEVRPIRVRAHAFGKGAPRRDLWLSPRHCIAFEDTLIPIHVLVNGLSVAQVATPSVEYWHVELDAHDVILAEGLAAESYLDNGNRAAFVNGGAFVEAHPDFRPKYWADTCLPLRLDGPAVSRAKAVLLDRLRAAGSDFDTDPQAHVVADGLRIEPERRANRLVFRLPEACREVELRARVFVPAQVDAESFDSRQLGLCVAALTLDGEPLALDGPDAPGWNDAEYEAGAFARR